MSLKLMFEFFEKCYLYFHANKKIECLKWQWVNRSKYKSRDFSKSNIFSTNFCHYSCLICNFDSHSQYNKKISFNQLFINYFLQQCEYMSNLEFVTFHLGHLKVCHFLYDKNKTKMLGFRFIVLENSVVGQHNLHRLCFCFSRLLETWRHVVSIFFWANTCDKINCAES